MGDHQVVPGTLGAKRMIGRSRESLIKAVLRFLRHRLAVFIKVGKRDALDEV